MRSKHHLLTAASRPNFDAIRLHIEYVQPHAVQITRRAIKKQRQSHIKKIAAGMDRNGCNVPVLVDEHLGLVVGEERLAAAKLLGLAQLPVIRIAHLTEEQLQLFRIFEEKVASESEFDEEGLELTFAELRLADPEVDLTGSGFAIGEIDAIEGRARTRALNDLDDATEPAPDYEPVTRLGDKWRCGSGHIMCGDATDPNVIEKLVGGATIQLVVSDPPYNLPTATFSSSGHHGNFGQGYGELTEEAFIRFLQQFMLAAQPHLASGALLYAFMDWKHILELILAARGLQLEYKQLLVWAKSSAPGMGSFYRSGHELVGVFKYGNGKHRNNIQLGAFGRNRSNVLSYPGVMGTKGRGQALKSHPTVKNVAMIADLILDASDPGEAVLDSFGGSGTTLIAAHKVDRVAYLCELSPAYVDTALRRFEAVGAGPAILDATGQTFAEVEAERRSASPVQGDR